MRYSYIALVDETKTGRLTDRTCECDLELGAMRWIEMLANERVFAIGVDRDSPNAQQRRALFDVERGGNDGIGGHR